MAEDYPKTILELEERFSTEQACREYLARLRWPDGFVCSRCGESGGWWASRGRLVCHACRYQASVTAGTIFHRTQKPLRLWFRAIWHITSQKTGASAVNVQQILGLGSYQTAWTWLHKLRRAMVRPERDRLGGRVEVDQTLIRLKHEDAVRRSTAARISVAIAAEEDGKGIGRIRMARVLSPSKSALERFVKEMIEPGSTVHTDGHASYGELNRFGYNHEVSVLSGMDRDAPTQELPRVHRVASLLKRWLLGTHQGAVRPSHLDYYLDEFTFRFNRRTSRSRGKLFYRLVQQAAQIDPAPYRDLVGGKDGDATNHNM